MRHAFPGVALGLAVERPCCPYFSNRIMASRDGPAQPRGMAWNGAGGWAMASQSRQENFSRTVSTTFHWRGMTSSVRVTSSPSFLSRAPPQQGQALGGPITTRSRGKCSGNTAFSRGRDRGEAGNSGLARALFSADHQALRLDGLVLKLQSQLVDQLRPPLRAPTVEFTLQLGDLQLLVGDGRLSLGHLHNQADNAGFGVVEPVQRLWAWAPRGVAAYSAAARCHMRLALSTHRRMSFSASSGSVTRIEIIF